METRVTEVADGVHQLTTHIPESGLSFNQYLDVTTLALMHGPAFTGDCRAALLDLADDFDKRGAALA